MAQRFFVFVCIQAIIFQMSSAQVLNRLMSAAPPCGCPLELPYLSTAPTPLSYLPSSPQVIYDQPTTIIQDSTVANNLANALQLLVVSNLLSSALPLEPPAPLYAPLAAPALAPAPLYAPLELSAPLVTQRAPAGCGCGCGGLNPYTILY